MTIGQGGKAHHSHPRDPTGFVLVLPLSPENTLPHVEDAPVLEVMASIEPKRLAVD
jgi:hypothetical protein